jgi:hypothetical protein
VRTLANCVNPNQLGRAMFVGIKKIEKRGTSQGKNVNNNLELEIEFGPKLGQNECR